MLQTSKFILWLLIALIAVACSSPGPPQPPRGYRNQGALKFAYVTKMLKLIDPSPEIPENLIVDKDLVFKETEEKTLKLDIYRHRSVSEPTPTLVFIHGGSWKSGDKDDYRRYLVDYAEKGYVTATVSYRFAQEAPFPAAFHDVVCAVKWLKAHAGEYFIDPDRMAVVGGSAGGHLAMMLGYHGDDDSYEPECETEGDAAVKAIVNLYGPADLRTDFAINHPTVIKFVGKTYSEETKDAYDAVSPLHFITPDDPPTLTFHGTIDDIVPVEQSDKLDEALKQNNVPSYYHRLEGWPHTMDLGRKVNRYCQYHMDAFFAEHLDFEGKNLQGE